MKNLINIIAKAIDCPLMDTHNIPFEIADYLVHRIFYLQYEGEPEIWTRVVTNGCFLATNEDHAWELYEEKTKHLPRHYKIKKGDFMENLSGGNGSYLTTNGASVRHLKIETFDDRDDFHMVNYEYKKPTRNVNRKEITEFGLSPFVWYLPMINVMMDGAEYNPLTILRR